MAIANAKPCAGGRRYLPPPARAALIARAKRAAVPVVNRVAARVALDGVLDVMSRDDLAAMVIVLAASADHARLLAIVADQDDGHPDPLMRRQALVWAHAEFQRQSRDGEKPDGTLRALEREYQRVSKQEKRAAKGKGSEIRAVPAP